METSKKRPSTGTLAPPKTKKTKTVAQRFKYAYSLKYPCMTTSRTSDSHSFCKTCRIDISVAHGGLNDCSKHISSASHKQKASVVSGACKITSFMSSSGEFDSINAEVMFTNFIIEHNLPISVADHAGPLFRKMFPDSDVAKKYSCARTKTTAIVQMLGDDDEREMSNILRTNSFSLATDGSTDMDDAKLYPVVVRYFDQSLGRIVCSLLTMVEWKDSSTGENIFKLLCQQLSKRNIPWSNCISFSSDNASVMSGMGKGVAGHIYRLHPSIYFMGCACHLMNIAAQKAASELPCEVSDILIDIYYYLDKSPNRKQHLGVFQELHGKKIRKILKLVNTRWLSLGHCLNRLLEMWTPLHEYFQSEKENLKYKGKSVLHLSKASCTQSQESAKASKHSRSSEYTSSMNDRASAKASQYSKSRESTSSTNARTYTQLERNKHKKATPQLDSKLQQSQLKHDKAQTKSQPRHTISGQDKGLIKKPSTVSRQDKGPSKQHSSDGAHHSKSDKVKTPPLEASGKDHHSTAANDAQLERTFDLSKYLFKQTELGNKDKQNKAANKVKVSKSECPQGKGYAFTKVERVVGFFAGECNKLYCLFLKPLFEHANLVLQKEEPSIHILHRTLLKQLKEILIRYVKAAYLVSNITEVDYANEEAHKSDQALFIGQEAKDFISTNPDLHLTSFYMKVKQYYITATRYMLEKFPFNDKLLIHAEVADPKLRMGQEFASVCYFTKRFPILLPDDQKLDELEGQFLNYQIDTCLQTNVERADIFWSHMSCMKDENGQLKYNLLGEVMLGVLTIFHSNADSERIFSV